MPVQERAWAGAVFWRGAFGGSGRGGMDSRFDGREGAELAGGFAAVADSQVRVFEHRDTMLVGWGASGRGLAHGTRDGCRAETWRRPGRGTCDRPRRRAAAGWFHTRELRHGARKRGTNAIPNSSRIAPDIGAGCAERRLVAHAARRDSRNTRRDARTFYGAGGGGRRAVCEQVA